MWRPVIVQYIFIIPPTTSVREQFSADCKSKLETGLSREKGSGSFFRFCALGPGRKMNPTPFFEPDEIWKRADVLHQRKVYADPCFF